MYKTTTFPNWYEPERGLVVHLVVGIHVANVAVADQVHVSYVSISNFNHVTEAEAASTWRHMLSWSYHRYSTVQNWCQIDSN
jgi:hypothetical protein